jgi:hypothetical protein
MMSCTTYPQKSLILSLTIFSLLLLALSVPARAQVEMLTQHNDNGRTGANLKETILNTSNVNVSQFGKLFSREADGQIYTQPLVVCGLTFPGRIKHNVVYIETEHNSAYAYDADDPNANAPLWHVNFGPSAPYRDFYKTEWTDMNEEVGVTSTPVIDRRTQTIYIESKTKENNQYIQRLHALDLVTGQEKFGGPVTIQAQVMGTGLDSVKGVVSFNPYTQLQRPGLLLLNGVVYLGFGSHADMQPFHGWLLGYNAKTLKQVFVFNTTPDGSEGAIWQSGQGPAADKAGSIYVALGNGDSDVQKGGRDYGECILKLNPTLKDNPVTDWFLPFNFADLNNGDNDLGASGPMLLPDSNVLVQGSKEGVMYVAMLNNLGHFHTADDSGVLQNFPGGNGHIHGSPVSWLTTQNERIVYVWSENDNLKTYKWLGDHFVPGPIGPSRLPYGMPGGFLTISADGSKPGTGIIWANRPYDANANWNTVSGLLQAFDASDPTHELWNSKQNAARDDFGNFAKFNPPTVVNGKVYLATFSKQLVVYGLLPKNAADAAK